MDVDLLNLHELLVPYFQPIRFVRFDNESVNRGLPALEVARGPGPGAVQKELWALGTRLVTTYA